MKKSVEVKLPVRIGPGQRPLTEILTADELEDNHYRLVFSPGLVESLAAGDEFAINAAEPSGFKVTRRGGNFCIWFFFPKQGMNYSAEAQRLVHEVASIGGRMDGGGETTLVFTVPAASGFDRIADFFDDAVLRIADSAWSFSNAYEPTSGAPLDWWQTWAT
ncbi:DUF4265 domain-containing protein [Myxococcus sp. AB036A]|uniref:DUF4265 domain-containing protein n=1 Tax=Myxococcus sp. AB036A TaxID=2562793 RepID=UPI0011472B33|nr:DUF4265 domain-containing protein [Myxococcus sp. AB036A]